MCAHSREVHGGGSCPVPSPCLCLNELIDCSSRQLSQVPGFTHTLMAFPKLYLNLMGNRISWLPSNGFSALRATGAKEIVLLLDDNQIQTIQDNAFAGVEDLVTEISIPNNRLTNVPKAFGKLTNLHSLWIQNNDLAGLDLNPSQNFGKSLTSLKFTANNMQAWPSRLSVLHSLRHLSIDKIPFSTLPTDSFKGFELSLSALAMTNSKISVMPEAICKLSALQVLELNNNKQMSVSTNTPICPTPLKSVVTIKLLNNDFDQFPDVFSTFTNANSIRVSGNPNLLFVPSRLFTPNNALEELNLQDNRLEQVPAGLRNLNKLTKLNLNNNNIRVIQGNAFDTLHELDVLELNGNPLSYIDAPAFSGLTALSTLALDDTDLHTLPDAVTSLPKLDRLTLENNDIKCDCNLLDDPDWSGIDKVRITGQCQNSSMSIDTYVKHYFKLC